MFEANHKRQSKTKTIVKLKEMMNSMMNSMWGSLPWEPIDRAVKKFIKRLKVCVAAGLATLSILSDCGIVNMNV